MTLSVAWIRAVGDVEELIFASDSRLRGGEAWDCCPKIMTLPRTDCLISFAGATSYAYPVMLQMSRAIEFYPPSANRRTDIAVAKGHTLRIFNQMRSLIYDLPVGQNKPSDPETVFLFGGFSWKTQSFHIWKLHYDPQVDAYTFRPTKKWGGQEDLKLVAFAGDAVDDARDRLTSLLRDTGKLTSGSFNMEPFEVLRDMIRSSAYPTIGGAPQVAKVYKYMDTRFFAVKWPDNDGTAHILGRPALDYERFDAPVIDPDLPTVHSFHQNSDDALAQDIADTGN